MVILEEIHRIFGDSNITVKVITDPEVTFIEKAEENTPVNQDIPNQNEQCAIPVVTGKARLLTLFITNLIMPTGMIICSKWYFRSSPPRSQESFDYGRMACV